MSDLALPNHTIFGNYQQKLLDTWYMQITIIMGHSAGRVQQVAVSQGSAGDSAVL